MPSPPPIKPRIKQSSASAVVTPDADAADSYLIASSATLAEQAAVELARRGFPVRPSRIGTLEQFLGSWCTGWGIPPVASRPLLHILIAQALERSESSRLSALRESRQLHAALAGLLEEILPEASAPHDLANVFQRVRRDLAARGVALRHTRLRSAAARIREGAGPLPARVIFEGFLTPQPGEQELVEALRTRTAVIVRPPEISYSAPRRVLFSAATPEREAEEIARRILDYAAQGHPFRDMAIVLRSRDPYSGIVETALGRFGIPFRSYFADPLASHPAIGFLSRIVQSLLDGWDHAKLLSALRMPVSGVSATPSGDRFDFALREHLPGRGLGSLDTLPERPALLERLVPPEDWRTAENEPRAWAERLKTLTKLLPLTAVAVSHDEVFAVRSTAAAVRGFQAALDRIAAFLPSLPISLAQFWPHVETALALEVLHGQDRRSEVVRIADVFEARQWNPPIVFICGLLERIFPLYHREDPLVGDVLRARWGLSTAAQRQQEERTLFELAVTRASEEAVLSYPRLDEKGGETIPSVFLEDSGRAGFREVGLGKMVAQALACEAEACSTQSAIQDPALTSRLARQHRKLSPTAIESFLQCPFQFFARRTLDLRPRPKAPQDRLDALAQGNIMHRALAEWVRFPLLGAQALQRVFEEECARLRIPPGYRTEAVRLELLRNFEALLRDPHIPPGSLTTVEQEFRFRLTPALTIRGRMDRLDTAPSGQALVIDYKYSAGNKIRERVEESEAGNLVQAGLYMLAAERALGREPAGMLYCGVKKQVAWGGWHLDIPGIERLGESRTRAALRELMDDAAGRAAEVYEEIASGNVAVRPLDPDKCGWCDYRDACRVELQSRDRRER
ncbi:MAG TPA: PD-(D/E)XK nuclease family protein [Bryobacteraceae bacterium]